MGQSDCIFCKIAAKELSTNLLYEDADLIAFEDIDPKAPSHVLVVPKEHIETMDDLETKHGPLVGRMLLVGAEMARKKGIDQEGYRAVINCRKNGGQEVFHLHLHILGGRPMRKMG